jgi:hypothetical protein
MLNHISTPDNYKPIQLITQAYINQSFIYFQKIQTRIRRKTLSLAPADRFKVYKICT